ncbi:MAG TPA: hypothetical protein VHM00_13045 [Caldimonas sp.]|jgi:uncharacterized membrane protein YidH (DUF202 family)|nr:hypothetical protein [Caldimonas sp.]HEX2541996.1 hypothetical protein [Caldimonas sp.]
MDWIVTAPFVYPALEAAHIFGIGLLVGSLFVFELRVWGLGRAVDAPALGRLALPVTLGGFCLAAATGSIMFAAQAAELIANRAFLLKMGLLLLAGGNAIWFHLRGAIVRGDALARLQTVVSLGLWIGVIICGRWIAYQ